MTDPDNWPDSDAFIGVCQDCGRTCLVRRTTCPYAEERGQDILVQIAGRAVGFDGAPMPGQKKRFEVFKRDGFTCQYCGRRPPQVVLECDHVEPVSKGGTDDETNLLTACFDCNRGKTDVPLDQVLPSVAERAEIEVERAEQVKALNKALAAAKRAATRAVGKVVDAFPDPDWISPGDRQSIRRFLKDLPEQEVVDAMESAAAKSWGNHRTFRYFCGICWTKIKATVGAVK